MMNLCIEYEQDIVEPSERNSSSMYYSLCSVHTTKINCKLKDRTKNRIGNIAIDDYYYVLSVR